MFVPLYIRHCNNDNNTQNSTELGQYVELMFMFICYMFLYLHNMLDEEAQRRALKQT